MMLFWHGEAFRALAVKVWKIRWFVYPAVLRYRSLPHRFG
jgi:hypothetical protein